MGGLLDDGAGYGAGFDSEGSEEGGMLGFSADDMYELACQMLNPGQGGHGAGDGAGSPGWGWGV